MSEEVWERISDSDDGVAGLDGGRLGETAASEAAAPAPAARPHSLFLGLREQPCDAGTPQVEALLEALRVLGQQLGDADAPPLAPPPPCYPAAACEPPPWSDGGQSDDCDDGLLGASRCGEDADVAAAPEVTPEVPEPICLSAVASGAAADALEHIDRQLVKAVPGEGGPASSRAALRRRVDAARRELRLDQLRPPEAHGGEMLDVDGWPLPEAQRHIVRAMEEDLFELRVLLSCCQSEGNGQRLGRAVREMEVKLRVGRTWAWVPLTSYRWSGYEHEQPVITVDFKIPGASRLPQEDVHCDFGVDWFDLKLWNVTWPDDPGTRYHHRAKKTRLMRDIVPSECSVQASGNHVYVKLQKVRDSRHGFCAWPDLCAGKGRKPYKFDTEAPDGGLMDFFEGEYEKYEGHDEFRRDIGKAMEKIHRGEPARGPSGAP